MAHQIDWSEVDQRLTELRQAGDAFLSTQLKAVASPYAARRTVQ